MGVWLGPMGKSKKKLPPKYTYTGTPPTLYQITKADGTVDWELVFTGNCTITFQRVVDAVDLFLVGGGSSGGAASGNIWGDGYYAQGGNGGAGGQIRTIAGVPVSSGTAYAITVGDSGQATYGFGYSAASGGGDNGGTGAFERQTPGARQAGTNGTAGSYAFDSASTLYASGTKYGADGGGGGAANINMGGSAAGRGGATGGGDGGTSSHGAGYDGGTNTGGGGGGGYAKYDSTGDYWGGPGGAGGSGIIIIRNAR